MSYPNPNFSRQRIDPFEVGFGPEDYTNHPEILQVLDTLYRKRIGEYNSNPDKSNAITEYLSHQADYLQVDVQYPKDGSGATVRVVTYSISDKTDAERGIDANGVPTIGDTGVEIPPAYGAYLQGFKFTASQKKFLGYQNGDRQRQYNSSDMTQPVSMERDKVNEISAWVAKQDIITPTSIFDEFKLTAQEAKAVFEHLQKAGEVSKIRRSDVLGGGYLSGKAYRESLVQPPEQKGKVATFIGRKLRLGRQIAGETAYTAAHYKNTVTGRNRAAMTAAEREKAAEAEEAEHKALEAWKNQTFTRLIITDGNLPPTPPSPATPPTPATAPANPAPTPNTAPPASSEPAPSAEPAPASPAEPTPEPSPEPTAEPSAEPTADDDVEPSAETNNTIPDNAWEGVMAYVGSESEDGTKGVAKNHVSETSLSEYLEEKLNLFEEIAIEKGYKPAALNGMNPQLKKNLQRQMQRSIDAKALEIAQKSIKRLKQEGFIEDTSTDEGYKVILNSEQIAEKHADFVRNRDDDAATS